MFNHQMKDGIAVQLLMRLEALRIVHGWKLTVCYILFCEKMQFVMYINYTVHAYVEFSMVHIVI